MIDISLYVLPLKSAGPILEEEKHPEIFISDLLLILGQKESFARPKWMILIVLYLLFDWNGPTLILYVSFKLIFPFILDL